MKQKVLFAMLMGLITTAVVSFTLISFNLGFKTGFVLVWLRSWMLAYFTAIPVILILSPKVTMLVSHLCKPKHVS